MNLSENETSTIVLPHSSDKMNVILPGLTKDEVDKSCTSGNTRYTSEALSITSHARKPGSYTDILNIEEERPYI